MKSTNDFLLASSKNSNIFYELTSEERTLLKCELLSIYKDIITISQKYNLTLMLGGGSVLGAVRHQGFIPWDDDIDLMMPRQDYNKFIQIFEKELGENYLLQAPCTSHETNTLFIKVVKKNTILKCFDDYDLEEYSGIRVDIFPIENAPNNLFIRKCKFFILDTLKIIINSIPMYQSKNKLLKKALSISIKAKIFYYTRIITGCIFLIFGKKNLYNFYDKIASSSKGNVYCTIPTGRKWSKGECQRREVFFPPKKIIFEGIESYIPNDSHTYLKNLYGDYLTIPPVEKRERHYYIEFSVTNKENK